MNKVALIIIICILSVICMLVLFLPDNKKTEGSLEILSKTWNGYKKYFIDNSGRVKRPLNNDDTVSEGQAYAMFRAVLMNDKDTFDKCYSWTENNLSRKNITGDNLLCWHWQSGKPSDLMPASDADIDYALALVFAHKKWDNPPANTQDYGEKAKEILSDILLLETYSTAGGRLYLSPWILPKDQNCPYPVNPSYYSPAHFKIFYDYTKNDKWLKLVETTYYVLNSLQNDFAGQKGVGLIPDWCAVDNRDRFIKLENKNDGFGYEALRVPFRIGLDYLWFNSAQAKQWLEKFNAFLLSQIFSESNLYCEYSYSGKVIKKYQSPAFYSCYYYAANDKYKHLFLEQTRKYLKAADNILVYLDTNEYYVNSLSWLAEGQHCGIIKNLYEIQN